MRTPKNILRKKRITKAMSLFASSAMVLGLFSPLSTNFSVRAEGEWSEVTDALMNGDFESDLSTGWSSEIDWNYFSGTWTAESGMTNNDTNVFHYYNAGSDSSTITLSQQTSSLDAGTYYFSLEADGSADYVLTIGDSTSDSISFSSVWDIWNKVSSNEFTLSEDGTVDLSISITVQAGG